MALVVNPSRRARQATVALQAAAALGQFANAKQSVDYLANSLKGLNLGRPGPTTLSQKLGPPNPGLKQWSMSQQQSHSQGSGSRRTKIRTKKNKNNRLSYVGVPRNVSDFQSVRIGLRDVNVVTNTASQVCIAGFSIGIQQGAGTLTTLTAFVPRMANFAAMYREFKVNSFTAEFTPYQASTTSGSVALAIDPDPDTGLPAAGNFSALMRHRISCMSDLVNKCSITYRPSIDGKNDPRYTSVATGRSDDEYNFGCFLIASSNSQTSGASIGYVTYSVDVTFYSPC